MTALSSFVWWPIVLAPFIGSFLGVVVLRAETPLSIVVGRSACPACGARLGVRDLIPIFSWLALRGRCRHCHQTVGAFYPAIELAAIGVAVWAAFLATGWLLWVVCLFGWTLVALAAIDFKYYLLPDFITLPLIPAGLFVNWLIDPSTVLDNVIGAGCGLVFVVGLRYIYRMLRGREGIGLGDAKLLAAAGAWVSWAGLSSVVLLAAVVGLGFAWFGRRGKFQATDRVPFGAFLCLGLWVVWLYGPLQIG